VIGIEALVKKKGRKENEKRERKEGHIRTLRPFI
jgi:hypothetical protein